MSRRWSRPGPSWRGGAAILDTACARDWFGGGGRARGAGSSTMTHFKTLHEDWSRTGHSTPDWIGVVRRSRGCGPDNRSDEISSPDRRRPTRPAPGIVSGRRGSRSHLGGSTADASGGCAHRWALRNINTRLLRDAPLTGIVIESGRRTEIPRRAIYPARARARGSLPRVAYAPTTAPSRSQAVRRVVYM